MKNFRCVFLVKTQGLDQSKMQSDGQMWWKNLHVPQTLYIKHIVCKFHFLQQSGALFLRFAYVCSIEKTQLNEKGKKWWRVLWPCDLIWIRMLWLWGNESCGIRKEGTTNMQTEQLETRDLQGESGTSACLTEIHRQWKRNRSNIYICSSHFPLLGAQTAQHSCTWNSVT